VDTQNENKFDPEVTKDVQLNMNQLIFDVGIQKKLADMSNIDSVKSIETPLEKNNIMLKGS
jgi:hypothetical protein